MLSIIELYLIAWQDVIAIQSTSVTVTPLVWTSCHQLQKWVGRPHNVALSVGGDKEIVIV